MNERALYTFKKRKEEIRRCYLGFAEI